MQGERRVEMEWEGAGAGGGRGEIVLVRLCKVHLHISGCSCTGEVNVNDTPDVVQGDHFWGATPSSRRTHRLDMWFLVPV